MSVSFNRDSSSNVKHSYQNQEIYLKEDEKTKISKEIFEKSLSENEPTLDAILESTLDEFDFAGLNSDPEPDLKLKVCIYSQVDASKEISLSFWAVSIIVEKEFPHTRLFIEGVGEKKGIFRKMAHLTSLPLERMIKNAKGSVQKLKQLNDCHCGYSKQGIVKWHDENIDLEKYLPNRETWLIVSEKIQTMITEIEWEMDHPEVTPFNIRGENSVFSGEKEVITTRDPELFKICEENPEKYNYIYYLRENKKMLENSKWVEENLNLPSKIAIGMLSCITLWGMVALCIRKGRSQSLLAFLSVFGAGKLCVQPTLKKERQLKKDLKENEEWLKLVEKVTVQFHNCFSWARKKLKMVDIQLDKKWIEWIGIFPKWYLRHQKNQENVREDGRNGLW